jgi:AraC-like DNA-binding protein/mannose-6-phosphate isomerase-like protein (cupin superfamily)
MDYFTICIKFKLIMPGSIRKKEGFSGQQSIVIPKKILTKQCEQNNAINSLYITDIGYYPKAKFHYRERRNGADQHIFISCIEGRGAVCIESNQFEIKAGDFILIPMHQAHKYVAHEEDPWSIYWIHFKGSAADNIVDLMKQRWGGLKGNIHYREERVHLFRNIYNQLERGFSCDNITFANMCIGYLLSSFVYHDKFGVSNMFSTRDVIDQSIDYMGKKIDQMITLEEIAGSINLSPSHFSCIFKKKTGLSPIEYFNQLKIQKSCQYLLFTNLRVKEIAFKLGIEDPYYFSRLFTKFMGVSPNEYREEKRVV